MEKLSSELFIQLNLNNGKYHINNGNGERNFCAKNKSLNLDCDIVCVCVREYCSVCSQCDCMDIFFIFFLFFVCTSRKCEYDILLFFFTEVIKSTWNILCICEQIVSHLK